MLVKKGFRGLEPLFYCLLTENADFRLIFLSKESIIYL